MTVSPTSYSPMCLDPRHYLFLVPIAALAAAPEIVRFVNQGDRRKDTIIAVTSAILIIISWSFNYENKIMYLALGILILLKLTIPYSSKAFSNGLILTFIAILAIQPLHSMMYARSLNYSTQKAVVERWFKKSLDRRSLVLTNTVQSNMGSYQMAFDSSRVLFMPYDQVRRRDILWADDIYVMRNGHARYLSGLNWDDIPEYGRNTEDSSTILFDEDGIQLFTVQKNEVMMTVE